ncbi:MAG: QueT transporter family protein [Nitrososphaerota archaeon]|uniref:QueT transporter family protein n=1 Tax=Candidatus Bathycorpusculum sp. TaxID=2994959 RepID=UPI00282C14B5|nr:QueT transporter family protein [Candidatus Termitimicrobium sp.]MCL2431175.1 QueT transporter family protein [Candidatus Termitimicrobium sp.]MDR0492302.1 QueT transporter family protein [Nitrososphaerota archaeon]
MKIQSKDLAVIAIYGALYATITIYFEPISYGFLQIRVSNAMLATVPLLGIAGVLGHTMGVFVANLYSTLGPIDLLNTIPSFIMTFAVYYIYKHTETDFTIIGTCIAYSVVLGVTVGWMLNYVEGLPLIASVTYVTLGNIASTLIGWPVFKALKKIGLFEKWFDRG